MQQIDPISLSSFKEKKKKRLNYKFISGMIAKASV